MVRLNALRNNHTEGCNCEAPEFVENRTILTPDDRLNRTSFCDDKSRKFIVDQSRSSTVPEKTSLSDELANKSSQSEQQSNSFKNKPKLSRSYSKVCSKISLFI